MVGVQPITLTLYSQQDLDREVIVAMEVSHAKLATLGSEANKWIAENEYSCCERPSDDPVECSSEVDSINENESHAEEEQTCERYVGLHKRNEDLEVAGGLERQLVVAF